MMTPEDRKDPAKLQAACDAYFSEYCAGRVLLNQHGDPVVDRGRVVMIDFHPPSIAGLALWLDFTMTSSLAKFQNRHKDDELGQIVARAKLRIEVFNNEQLYNRDSQRGAQFTLQCGFGGYSSGAAHDEGKLPDIIIALRETQAKKKEEE